MLLHEKIAYLADLATILDFHEDGGAIQANRWMAKEFLAIHAEVLNELQDKHDETRKRNVVDRDEAGTDLKSDRSWRSVPDRDDPVVEA